MNFYKVILFLVVTIVIYIQCITKKTSTPTPSTKVIPRALEFTILALSSIYNDGNSVVDSLALNSTESDLIGFAPTGPGTVNATFFSESQEAIDARAAFTTFVLPLYNLYGTTIPDSIGSGTDGPVEYTSQTNLNVYKATNLNVNGDLTLTGGPSDQFIFIANTIQFGNDLSSLPNSANIILLDGLLPQNVFFLSQYYLTTFNNSTINAILIAKTEINLYGGTINGAAWNNSYVNITNTTIDRPLAWSSW